MKTMHTDKVAGTGPETLGIGASTTTVVAECNCTINDLTATCSHNRSQGDNGKLQIVASPNESRIQEYALMGVKITLKEEYSGSDKVDCSIDLQNNKSSSCFHITDENNEFINKSSNEVTFLGNEDEEFDKWPINASPTEFKLQGYGCDRAGKTITIENYPNQYFTVQADLDIFKAWSEGINKGWSTWAEKFFSVSPVELTPKIT